MRKIVAGLFMSLDGVVEAPEEWHFRYFNDEMGQAVADQMTEADTLLLGRATYEVFAASWPERGSEVPFADRINSIPKLVASTTLDTVEWQNSTLIRGDLAEQLTEIKKLPGKNIAVSGSITLVQSLLRDNLLDELRLLVHPVVLGSGRRLFETDGPRVPLSLTGSTTLSTGVLHLTYRPA